MMQAIGGYFELELPRGGGLPYPHAHLYQSARAAFCALLDALPTVERVWMPAYLCDSMYAPVHASGKSLRQYTLDAQLRLAEPIELAANDVLLYVNYFGVRTAYTDELLHSTPPSQLVIDCSQAFFVAPRNCLATIYSPRKFFGVPDGGMLVTDVPVLSPARVDESSQQRMTHLLARLAGEPESAYAEFLRAEHGLDDPTPMQMSALTQRLLASVPFAEIQQQRNVNFAYLRARLDASNLLSLPPDVTAPLCYPYLPSQPIDRQRFLQDRIYIPTYWPEVTRRAEVGSIEWTMQQRCLPIPCDQRYGPADLERILAIIGH